MKFNIKTKSLKMLLVFVAASFFIISCNNGTKKNTSTATEDKSIKEDIQEYVYPLVSSFDITKMLIDIEATYIVDIANDAANVEKYLTEQSKAVNLGVYSADLAYATTYNQKLQVQNYFKAIESLVGDLELTAVVNNELADKIEDSLDDTDALVGIITNLVEDTYSYLNKQGRKELSHLILAGSAFEGLYLTTHISENTMLNPKIVETILYQKEPLMKLEEMMAEFKDSELSADVYANVVKINAVFAQEESNSAITQEQFEELAALLEEIRNNEIQ